jgi:hypothetical protein
MPTFSTFSAADTVTFSVSPTVPSGSLAIRSGRRMADIEQMDTALKHFLMPRRYGEQGYLEVLNYHHLDVPTRNVSHLRFGKAILNAVGCS